MILKGRSLGPPAKPRTFKVHITGTAVDRRKASRLSRRDWIERTLSRYAEVRLIHAWGDSLLLWVDRQPVILRGVHSIL
ncbi:MAG: hypothetical protein D6791_03135 [Chloroflexi bacterium]|nr:MAG: hypothetical protein D6791_03135 [Chloroflexota bacterium]